MVKPSIYQHGYRAYLSGIAYNPHAHRDWRRGWVAARADYDNVCVSGKEANMMLDKLQEGNNS